MRTAILIFVLASVSLADRATKPRDPRDIAPKDPPTVTYSGAIADYTRPAFVPEFARNKTVPALQEQRDRALTHQPMPPVHFGWYGWYPYAYGYWSPHVGCRW